MKTSFFNETLLSLERANLKRQLKTVQSSQGREIVIDGKKVLNFCSNNYLGLADDIRLRQSAMEGIAQYGLGSGASRLVCGNMKPFEELEQSIARFKGTESSLVFSSGYMANQGIISSLFDRADIIFSDRLNHASIVDGILLSRAEWKRYPHRDINALEAMLKESKGFKKRAIITDTVFSMDGDIAPLDQLVSLAKEYDAWLMVDEAHALGVLGENGRGAAEHFGIEKQIDIQMGTLSKAVGSYGAYCCGSKNLMEYLINCSRSFIYTTALPPAIVAASLKALQIIQQEPHRRQKLWENTKYLAQGLRDLGFNILQSQTPIIPILTKDPEVAVKFSKKLFEEGVFIQAIRPPTVPQDTARLRLTVMATHTREDLDFLLDRLSKIGRELCLI